MKNKTFISYFFKTLLRLVFILFLVILFLIVKECIIDSDYCFLSMVLVFTSFSRSYNISLKNKKIIIRTMIKGTYNSIRNAYSRGILDPMKNHVRDYSYSVGKLKTPDFKRPGKFVVHYCVIGEDDKLVMDQTNPEIWINPQDNKEYQRVLILTTKPTTTDSNGNIIQNEKISGYDIYGKPMQYQYGQAYWILKSEVDKAFPLYKSTIDSSLLFLGLKYLKSKRADDLIII